MISFLRSAFPINFDIRLFIWLTLGFIVATIVGTITHELGHCVVAHYLGFEFDLDYGSMAIGELRPGYNDFKYSNNWVEAGGPLETILTGTIGFLLMYAFRKSYFNTIKLSLNQWIFIFLALFWLRSSFNLTTWIGGYFINGRWSRSGDELWVAESLYWPKGSILIITGVIGFLVLAIIIFKFIPPKQRIAFILSGLLGGILGFEIWFGGVGEYVMP